MGSGFESQGAHLKENPADSSESAGFLRSPNNALSRLEVHIILFAPAGDPSSQSSDTLMSRQRIYAPPRVSVFGVRCGPAGVAVDSRGFRVRPVPSELGRGGLSRFSVLSGYWMFCVWGGGGLSPFSLLLGGWCFARGAGEGCRLSGFCEIASLVCAEGSVPSVATSGCPKRSEGGCPCRSEDVYRPSSSQHSWV